MINKTNNFITLIILVFIVIINVSTCNAADGDGGDVNDYFTSCGGFINNNFKHNDNFIDYSKIVVKLVSIKDELVLERADCSPIDGYYFLPVYELGQYRIEIETPDSWVFDINSYTITDTLQCKKDLDFELLGFNVQGTINNDIQKCKINQDKDNQNSLDFSSVNVELVKSKLKREYHGDSKEEAGVEEDIVISIVNSEKNGNYKFISVVPISSGSEYQYKVRVVQPNWNFVQHEIPFQFQWNNYQITESFIVNGFDITGTVTNDNLSVKRVVFSLYSKVLNTIKNCKPIPNTIIKGFNSICSVESDEEGKFIFSNVPCTGDEILKIIPQYVKDDVKYEIVPEEVDLVIGGSVVIEQVFQIRGFSISGIVVNEMGKTIKGVEIDIYVNDEFKTKTDTDGIYILNEMKAGDYKIDAKMSNYKFKSLSKVTISPPNDMIIPDIQVESYQITGKFHLPKVSTSLFSGNSIPNSNFLRSSSFRSLGNNYNNKVNNNDNNDNNDNNNNNDDNNSPFFEFNKVELLLLQPLEKVDEQGNIGTEFKLVSTGKLDRDGRFEFDVVESGDYIVQIKSDQKQIKDHQVEFVIDSLNVRVDSKPVTDLIFEQLTTRINGKIKTLDGKNNRLIPPDLSIELVSTTSTPTTTQFQPHSVNENGDIEFKFEEILPGDYKVKIDFTNWYWDKEEIEITAFAESLVIDPTTLKPISIDFVNMVEFHQTGFKFEIESPAQLQQTGSIVVLHRYNGELIDSIPLRNGVNYLSLTQIGQHEFVIKSCFQFQEVHYTFETETSYYNGNGNQIKLEIEKYLIEGSIDLTDLFKEYHFLKQPDSISIKVNILNSKGELVDQLDTSLESSTIYQYNFMHSIDDQQFELVPDININNNHLLLKDSISIQPTSRFIKFNLNEQIGNCIPTIDPFIVNKKVEKEEELVNDKVEKIDIGSFGNIRVKLRDSKSDEPVGGAFLSLSTSSTSSNNQFRVNVQIPLNGTFDFNLLEPNKYYLKSVLKDYTISPSSQVIQVQEGQEQIIHLVAKKTIFSVTGVVCWLNSIPIPNILVQSYIVSHNPNSPLLFKEIKTNENGEYKLTGFTSVDPSFQIKLSFVNNVSLSSTPMVQKLNFNDELDKSNVNFIVVPSLSTISTEQFKLTGNILIDGKNNNFGLPINNNEYNSLLPNGLKVVIYNSNGIFIKSLDISMFNTFSTVLTKSKSFNYIIKIEKEYSSFLDYSNSNGKSFIGFGNKIKNNLIDNQDHYYYQIIPNQIQIPIDCLSNCQVSFKIKYKNNNGSFNLDHDLLKVNENNSVKIPYSTLLFTVIVILSILYPNKVYSFFKSLFTLDFIVSKKQNQNQKNQ